MPKFLLCDIAAANYGKSTTLNDLLFLFTQIPNLYKITPLKPYKRREDNVCVITCRRTNKVILIQTGGDSYNSFNLTNQYLSQGNNVDVLVCASRPKYGSYNAVNDLINKYNFHYIDFQNICAWRKIDIPFVKRLNRRFFVPALYELVLHLL